MCAGVAREVQCQRERGLSSRGSCLPAPVYQNRNRRHQHPQLPLQSQLSPQSPTLGGSAQNKGGIGSDGRSNEEQMSPRVDRLTIDIQEECRTVKQRTPSRPTRDGNHRQPHRPPSARKIRLRTTNEPNSCTSGLVRRQYLQRKKTHRRHTWRRGRRYNYEQVQKSTKIKKLDTHAHTPTIYAQYYPQVYHTHAHHATPQHT